ncbi:hypothetical protein ISF_07329 [Cordyceps fumosorosea ARSEF 2679]|uniref:Microtubule associated protein n=1 Tax=Cordyceps fumosorosea (strain ARSEF 2679) TaxID=1081104 RepID=A0A167PMC2_CORFA|nr:hypothetical protein ISF_07329 [Cordyceps fumosorosea ARSEF 2679]OAA56813.1 hypothetical protein ISF_07329 [Cordyceps fumosorosea ARSEF 2679]
MAAATRPPANAFVATMRRVYNPIGFGKGYNFVLWFIFCGALFGFCLARFMYLDFGNVYCPLDDAGGPDSAGPGECYSYRTHSVYLVGIKLHLFTIIPGAFLACFQFVPFIRLNYILVHRVNGYLVLLLSVAGTVGALMIARVAFGGGIEVQTVTGLLAIMFLFSLGTALYNIKKLQLEQHRAWMLRAWFYAGSIITSRMIMIISAMIISNDGPYYEPMSCAKLATFYNNVTALEASHPACVDPSAWSIARASMSGGAENAAASLSLTFGGGVWLALAIHAIGVEFYLQLTPAESERLRKISYQRQLEAGFSKPGRAGSTADRLGDAILWSPQSQSATSTYLGELASEDGK